VYNDHTEATQYLIGNGAIVPDYLLRRYPYLQQAISHASALNTLRVAIHHKRTNAYQITQACADGSQDEAHHNFLAAVVNDDLSLIRRLLDIPAYGCAINSVDKYGRSALMLALLMGHIDVAHTLISKGATMFYDTDRSYYYNVFIQAIRNRNIAVIEILAQYQPALLTSEDDFFSWTSDMGVLCKLIDIGATLKRDNLQHDALAVYGILTKSRSTYGARQYVTIGEVKAFVLEHPKIHPEVYQEILLQAKSASAEDTHRAILYTTVKQTPGIERNATLDHALYPVYCNTILQQLQAPSANPIKMSNLATKGEISASLIKAMMYLDCGEPTEALITLLAMHENAEIHTYYRKLLWEDVIQACLQKLPIADERLLASLQVYLQDCIRLKTADAPFYITLLSKIDNINPTLCSQDRFDAEMVELTEGANLDQEGPCDSTILDKHMLIDIVKRHTEARIQMQYAQIDTSQALFTLFKGCKHNAESFETKDALWGLVYKL